jgi:hypothetical protein
MTEEEILNKIETEFKEQFPDLPISEYQEQFSAYQKVILDFILPFQREEIFIYMNKRESSKCIAKHIAELPQGVSYFEGWLNNGLLNFAINILNTLQSTIAQDQIYLSFAHLLDSKNLQVFFENSKFSEEEENQLSNMLKPFIAESEFDLLLQALSCMYVGLDNSVKSLLQLWVQRLWFDGEDIKKVIEIAKEIEIENKKAAKDSQISNNKKHSKNRIIQSYAINKYLALPKSSYSTIKEAAELIIDDVINYSLTSPDVLNAEGNFIFYSEKEGKDRPKENIRRWIGKYRSSSLKEK